MTSLDAPFKCVGGKAKMVDHLRTFLPPDFQGYAEPFLGGGALFRSLASSGVLDGKPVLLSDASEGVVRTWRDVQRNVDLVETKLLTYEQLYGNHPDDDARAEHYYSERGVWNSGAITGPRHIFLRKLAFNGLWRENRSGRFNVPWGRYKRFVAPSVVTLARVLTSDVAVVQLDFGDAFQRLQPGWVVYVDPPYIGEFSAYTAGGFSLADHKKLLSCCANAKRRGVHVVYSNRYSDATVAFVQTHWPEATVTRAVRQQMVAAKSTARGAVEEMVAT